MRSLRLRFFLISWPIVVAAIAAVALSIDRFAVVELERVEVAPRTAPSPARAAEWSETIARAWPEVSDALLERLAASAEAPVDLVVLAPDGARIATTDRDVSSPPDSRSGDSFRVRRRIDRGHGRIAEGEFDLPGTPVRAASGEPLAYLVVLPPPPEPREPEPSPAWRTRFRRTLWTAAIVASVAAAAAALLLAGPLVGQVRRLTEASAAIGRGSLGARVDAKGEDELAQLGRSFDAMARTLERAEAHKRNLVGDVAHELRTPLTNIIGLVESMQDGLRTPDAETLASLRDEAGLLVSLVDDLQELSLAESGQLPFQMEPVDATAAARAAVEAIRAGSDSVEVLGPEALAPLLVRADARRLAQVLRNLLRNAITHTPPGGRVTVSVGADGSGVAIVVADTGHGIPAEHIALIWERFHRVDPSRDRASGGMGIGLTLVRQLVAGMGGEVGVESEVGRGSRFRVVLTAA